MQIHYSSLAVILIQTLVRMTLSSAVAGFVAVVVASVSVAVYTVVVVVVAVAVVAVSAALALHAAVFHTLSSL